MNYNKYSSSEPENADNSMEWEENTDIERLGACVVEGGTPSADRDLISGYTFSQPSTSGYTGQKRKSFFSTPLPTKISRNVWYEKQQQEEHPSVNETNLYKNQEVASGFSIAPPISQMMLAEPHGISSQAASDNISALLVNDDIDCSKVDISANPIDNIGTISGPTRTSHSFPYLDVVRGKINRPLYTEGPLPDTEGLGLLHRKGKPLSSNFCHPITALELNLLRHLKSHGIDEMFAIIKHFRILVPGDGLKCLICGMFVPALNPHEISTNVSNLSSNSDN
ncbi:hypothetical protein AVEN_40856-1 [Araneus ventricosus]|uniref:Uncharacterized protein n=1 Tax=Araneus ventricosus TaxID=182803 RepID=A0A4Y2L7K6_ARAVE|nr:hypothetical protein AVEN_40856-1 [Araneus ventricosus]